MVGLLCVYIAGTEYLIRRQQTAAHL